MRTRLIVMTLSVLAVLGGKAAAEDWRAERMEAAALPSEGFSEIGRPAPDGLPDGLVATAQGGDIAEAWYGGPTRRYGHAILGDAVEAGALFARTAGGAIVTLWLPESEVFEDRTPRLADLDGDGRTEIVTIRSSLTNGAAVTIYGLEDGVLKQRATTDFIGRSNRWLNIAAIADLDGTPGLEIAHVRTPHIGGTLIVHGYRNGVLVRIAALDGFSNHAIGSREMRLSAILDVDGDGRVELAVPSADRRALRIVGLDRGRLAEIASVVVPGTIGKPVLPGSSASDPHFVVGLDNGEVYRISR
ncbi:VCBS repeat-containing protein [Nitratireductor sp. XY-223]|uniref:VCBS repeat-containing protein n=1 Tax=Nitratireductor sp. XY-223 TaxID=2561926 RepID=UPI0010AB36E8|nr:VCBS repeat-containing protein [Nitratireductor sp. XY-223]